MVAVADPEVRVEPIRVVVDPGGQASLTVTVRNTGQIVEGFRLTVHGAAAEWAEVVATGDADPAERGVLRVYPGQEGVATIVFTGPPASVGLAGEVAFCVLAESVVDPSCSAAAEGDLEIGRVDGLTASITPVTSTGRWSGRHTVKISNWGNAPAKLRLVASDPDEALGFLVHPDRLDLRVGASGVAAVRVRSRHPFLRGSRVRLPFRVVAEPDAAPAAPVATPAISDPRRPVLDGALDQRPILSRATVALGALAVLALAAAVAVALTYKSPPKVQPRLDAAVAAPQGLTAKAQDSSTVRVAWQPVVPQPKQVHVFRIAPETQNLQVPATQEDKTVEGSLATVDFTGLTPETRFCFQAATVQGEAQSQRSSTICTQTQPAPAGPASGSTSATGSTPATSGAPSGTSDGAPSSGSAPGGSGTGTATTTSGGTSSGPTSSKPSESLTDFGDRWVVGVPVPATGPSSEVVVKNTQDRFKRAVAASGHTGLEVGRLDSTRYPRLGFVNASTLVYIGTFSSRDDAREACQDLSLLPAECNTEQPGMPS